MLNREKDERDGYVYDAAVKGGDTTFWAEVVGTIATDTTVINKTVRVSSARLHSFLQHIYGEYEFAINVPANPGTAPDHTWGLRNPKDDTAASDTGLIGGGVYFSVDTDAVFKVVSYDDFGNKQQTVVTWDSDWSGRAVKYQIRWEADHVKFLVNDSIIATHTTRVPTTSKTLELRNGAASSFDVPYIRVARAGMIV